MWDWAREKGDCRWGEGREDERSRSRGRREKGKKSETWEDVQAAGTAENPCRYVPAGDKDKHGGGRGEGSTGRETSKRHRDLAGGGEGEVKQR